MDTQESVQPDLEYFQPPTWRWLASTTELQESTYKYDYDLMRKAHIHERGQVSMLTRYLDWNQTAAIQELAEIREEFSWKPWARDIAFYNRDRIRDEIIDAMHFLGNMLTAIGVTDAELWEAYRRKQEINRQRAASGTYSAKKGGLAEGSDDV